MEIQKLEFDDIQDLDYKSLYDRVNDLQEEAREKLKNGDKKGAKRILIRKKFFIKKIVDYKNLTQKKEDNDIQDSEDEKEESKNSDENKDSDNEKEDEKEDEKENEKEKEKEKENIK